MHGRALRSLSIATLLVLTGGFALVFFFAPLDADQGFIQKIFYLHVPLAIVALSGFVAAGIFGIQYLRTRDDKWDRRSYVAIHTSIIFGVAVLITGSIWARASWGKWWVWDEPTLVSFLIVFLLYATYQPLRFSIEQAGKQARAAAVFSIAAGAFVPLNFIAVRLSENLVHPRVLNTTGGTMPGSMRLTFFVCLVGIALLHVTFCKLELTSKQVESKIKSIIRKLENEPSAVTADEQAATKPTPVHTRTAPARGA